MPKTAAVSERYSALTMTTATKRRRSGRINIARRASIALALLACLCALLSGCRKDSGREARVLLDGRAWDDASIAAAADDDLRVYITLDGAPLIDLPFSDAHTIEVIQPGGAENRILLTGDSVVMESANCENQDCVHMGEVTRDNLELRVMGGFIICLPHKLSVEVRGE